MTEENENLDEVLQDEAQLKELVEDATQHVPQGVHEDEGVEEVAEELTPDQQIAELQDKNVRLLAEMDNLRKRAMRDSAESRKYAALPLVNEHPDILEARCGAARFNDLLHEVPIRLVEGGRLLSGPTLPFKARPVRERSKRRLQRLKIRGAQARFQRPLNVG